VGRNRVTLQTIADRLGVSRTTVSNAYNRPDQLAADLRDRILAIAEELGYSGPDPAARRLRSGGRDAIGLMFEDLSYAVTDPAAVLFLQGIAEATAREGLGLLLLPARREGGGVELVRDAVVDAFILYSMPRKLDEVAAARARGLPVVVVDEPRGEGTAFVGIDDRAAMRSVAEHVVGLGHRHLAVVSDRIGDDDHTGRVDAARREAPAFELARERLAGCLDAFRGAGLGWDDVPLFEHSANTVTAGLELGRELLAGEPRPTAAICTTDLLAIGVMRAARERGLGVPAELSVSGFDDTPEAEVADLTTARQPLREKGALAGRLIVEGDAAGGREVILPTELVVRSSTGPAPAAG
jgi:DNA-binding LacI/PurR family transcriptional regulator